jgi:hypothetical protein
VSLTTLQGPSLRQVFLAILLLSLHINRAD